MTFTNRLGSTFELPITMSWTKVPHSVKIESERMTGDGAVFTGSSIEPRSFTVGGSLYYVTKEANRAMMDDLKKFLLHTPIEVDRGDGRNIIAYPQTVDAEYLDDDVEVLLTIGFIALDPYFYGAPLEAVGSEAISIENAGNVAAYPVITIDITGTCIDPTLTCGEQILEIVGEYTTGTIVVDCRRMTAFYEDMPIIGAMGDDWLIHSFFLTPDTDSVAFSATGSYTVDVTISWRPRWL